MPITTKKTASPMHSASSSLQEIFHRVSPVTSATIGRATACATCSTFCATCSTFSRSAMFDIVYRWPILVAGLPASLPQHCTDVVKKRRTVCSTLRARVASAATGFGVIQCNADARARAREEGLGGSVRGLRAVRKRYVRYIVTLTFIRPEGQPPSRLHTSTRHTVSTETVSNGHLETVGQSGAL